MVVFSRPFRQELFDLACQIDPGFGGAQITPAIHQPHCWDAEDAELERETILPTFAIEMLRPREGFLTEETAERGFFVVETDASGLIASRTDALNSSSSCSLPFSMEQRVKFQDRGFSPAGAKEAVGGANRGLRGLAPG